MTRFRCGFALPGIAALIVLSTVRPAGAHTGPIWSGAELTGFAEVIMTGRVGAVTSGWDPAVNAIYSYVTIDVSEVFRGPVVSDRITLKQLGGRAGDLGLVVADQATFDLGEQVLLFLEVRPRDGTLYTSALSQGKWNVATLANGQRVARRGAETMSMGSVRRAADASAPAGVAYSVETSPAEAASSHPFTLMATPYLYSFFPPVDVQEGGEPGLAGRGFAEVQTAMSRWNSAGSSFRFLGGSSTSQPRCAGQFLASYRVTISFLDPCGEISNTGGTIAVGGSYFTTAAGVTANGQFFRLALEGFVINNDSAVALGLLSVSGCFEDVQLHELGHVLGLGHSTDPAAIMFPTLTTRCTGGANGLGADDLQGVHFLYPVLSSGTPGQSIVTRVTSSEEILTIEWASTSGAAPTSHRLDFFSGTTHVAALTVGAATVVDIPIPLGTRGAFSVRVTPFNREIQGPPSNLYAFTIGTACVGAPAAPEVTGSVTAGTAAVSWSPVPGATRYIVQVGQTVGGADLVATTNVGTITSLAAGGLPPDFTAWVRVTAVNACGSSAATDFFLH